MMNIFEETYRGIQEAKRAYAAATNTAEQDAARAIYKQATAKLDGLSSIEQRIWNAYETAKDCGNEYIDLNDTIRDDAVEGLVACMKEYGIEAFTFSSTWSSAVETAWLFQKAGCTLAGLIEINSHHKNAKFIMNDQTIASIRQLKDNNGAYMWQPSLVAGEPDKLLGYDVYTSPFCPAEKIAFGDYSYYNIGDRGTRSFKQLTELFAGNGMIGYVAKERVDGKLILPEAVQILTITGSAKAAKA